MQTPVYYFRCAFFFLSPEACLSQVIANLHQSANGHFSCDMQFTKLCESVNPMIFKSIFKFGNYLSCRFIIFLFKTSHYIMYQQFVFMNTKIQQIAKIAL